MIAPFWWIHSTAAAYAAIKYANAVIMLLAAVPSYLLARMLVSRRGAVVVALGSVAIPGMAYATSIVSDVLAYPYYALCSWLAVRALRSKGRLDVALAIVAVGGGYFVRQKQFTSLVVALALAAAGLWLTGPRSRELRRNWSRGDTIGAVAHRGRRVAPLQPRRPSAHPRVAVHEPVHEEPASSTSACAPEARSRSASARCR